MTEGSVIRLDHPVLVADRHRLRSLLTQDQRENSTLLLIGRRHLRSNNSWMHNLPRLVGGTNRGTLLMHPEDAQSRGIAAGQQVRVQSEIGEIEVEVDITDAVMSGVVSLPHGWGHARTGTRWRVAESTGAASVNDIISTRAFDPLSGNAAVTGVIVTVTAGGEEPSGRGR